ncbi:MULTISPECIES: F0F1 ATP synthase subunit delta [unclassified Enterococcus]|uniref:F0F1 ATP synthase subunit delta n=1 Tax=unclassified Enterococcus TaxID=2608891 RepID=UPI00155249D4|nr:MULTISPECIES: F0F1 ATP synthase subunit delta [unclassified Enterococcus]MBS7577218.1 F0F1 ATP synthase subunit delta [Enterococcus sp. MMGLQ5-2]MBS7584689.1 F0F1 ATP synthase subunit delta [Enterococcus sp. MMGLQ5-1]NPD12544.1 F0F1 ATP synthase subunit delta [Enterococcus sp. MMGLQ5-1]NPD37052.1 F0F1 ATP synthase subunit delta [Enterococcus sp. MMGLQ5-2]
MTDNHEIINKYAEALVSVAKTHNELSAISAEIDALINIISNNSDVFTIFELATFSAQRDVVDALKSQAMPHVQNFLEVLYQNRRLPLILDIFEQYKAEYRKETGTGQVTITSAVELSNQQMTRLVEQLKVKFDYQAIEVEQRVAPEILGGIIVEVDHKIIDGSLKTQLDQIAEQIR